MGFTENSLKILVYTGKNGNWQTKKWNLEFKIPPIEFNDKENIHIKSLWKKATLG